MGYLFLSLALAAGLTKGFCGKKMGNVAANISSAALLNGVRMLFCILFGFVVLLFPYPKAVSSESHIFSCDATLLSLQNPGSAR